MDAIVATGRSDCPNQVNNVLGFPYLFRGALDIHARARAAQARMIFAEGDDPRVLRAAVMYQRSGLGKAMVVGRVDDLKQKPEASGLADAVRELEAVNTVNASHLDTYKDFLYDRLQRKGHDRQDIQRLAARDRHVFGALMLAHGHGDGLVYWCHAEIGPCAGPDQHGV